MKNENKIFNFEAFNRQANTQNFEIFEEAKNDREAFWGSMASHLHWFQPWTQVLEWQPPYAKWFVNGKLNACTNCLDVHLEENSQKLALIWEGERGEKKTFTYQELYEEVNKFSHLLKSKGVQKGDRVTIYLPLIPEAIISMLACARIGAIHVVVFGGFSKEALKERTQDAESKLIITADGGFRKGTLIGLKEIADQAALECPTVQNIIVVKRTGQPVEMKEGRDYWVHELIQNDFKYFPPEEMDAEDVLFILYTSGTTGKPKGIVHTTGGYMVGVHTTTQLIFDVKPQDNYWCTADVGWITGHSYIVYGPFSCGMTQLIYEGSFDWPTKDRAFQLIEKYQISILYTAPTLIRTFMKWGEKWPKKSNLASLRLLGSVGEAIDSEAWMWYYTYIGQKKCPIVDTWWQTETGSILIAPIPGLIPLKPGSATLPLPGIEAKVLVNNEENSSGPLVISSPWPSMLRGVYKDSARYENTYWKKEADGCYFTGDSAEIDETGYFWLLGRMDDVINVSGHRLGSIEMEGALMEHPDVAETAVIGIGHEVKGQAIAAFVNLKEGVSPSDALLNELKEQLVKKIGRFARPEKIIWVRDLPKTRSGKVMRRLLRDVAEGRLIGDTTTLVDSQLLEELKKDYEEEHEE